MAASNVLFLDLERGYDASGYTFIFYTLLHMLDEIHTPHTHIHVNSAQHVAGTSSFMLPATFDLQGWPLELEQ